MGAVPAEDRWGMRRSATRSRRRRPDRSSGAHGSADGARSRGSWSTTPRTRANGTRARNAIGRTACAPLSCGAHEPGYVRPPARAPRRDPSTGCEPLSEPGARPRDAAPTAASTRGARPGDRAGRADGGRGDAVARLRGRSEGDRGGEREEDEDGEAAPHAAPIRRAMHEPRGRPCARRSYADARPEGGPRFAGACGVGTCPPQLPWCVPPSAQRCAPPSSLWHACS